MKIEQQETKYKAYLETDIKVRKDLVNSLREYYSNKSKKKLRARLEVKIESPQGVLIQ